MHTPGQIRQLRYVDVKLVVRYTGIKATQYFTKFTDESVDIFRQDLFTLKLPHPKKENISLLSHGCVEAKWFAVPSKGVFHQQLLAKSDVSQQMREQLSIETIAARSTLRPLVQPENFQKPVEKSWLADIAGPSTATPSKKVFVLSRDAVSNWTKDLIHGRDPWAANAQERPQKRIKLDAEDASASETQESSGFPAFTNLPPVEPHNQGSANIRLFVQSMPKQNVKAKETPQGQAQSPSVNSTAYKNDSEMSKESQIKDNAPGSSVANTPRFRVKEEPNDDDDSLLLQLKPIEQNNVHTGRPSISDHNTTTTSTTHEPQTSVKSEPQTDDDLAATLFLASLNLCANTPIQQWTNEPRSHQDSQMPIWQHNQHSPSRVNRLESTTNPPPSNFYERSNWYQDSEVPPFRGPGAETMASSSEIQESSGFPAFTNLPPLEPRNQGSANRRLFVQSMPKQNVKAKETPQGQAQSPSVISTAYKDDSEMSKESQIKDNAPGSSVANTPFRVKEEPNDNDDALLLQLKPIEQNNVHANRPSISDHNTSQTTTSMTHEPQTSIKSEPQTDDDLAATLFLASLNLCANTPIQQWTSEPRSHQDSQMPIWQPKQHSPSKVNPLESTTNPTFSNFYERSNWYQDAEVPPFRGPAAETMRSAGSLTSLSTSRQASTPSLSSWGGSVVPPVGGQASSNNHFNHNFTSTTQSEDIDMSYRHHSTKNGEGHRAASQRLQRELFGIKREISANVAREAAVIAQLKELKVSPIPAPVIIGHDPSEEMKDDLARLEHELAAERKLREEAEAVIADMRRELKAPFVVPSLFDAFVQLSHLTTQGLRAGAASGSSEPKDEVMNGVTSEHKANEPADISMSPPE